MKPGGAEAAALSGAEPMVAGAAVAKPAVGTRAVAKATAAGLSSNEVPTNKTSTAEAPINEPPTTEASTTEAPTPEAWADETSTHPTSTDGTAPAEASATQTATTVTHTAASTAAAAAWRAALAALAVLLPALAWLYRDTATAMVAIWSRSDTFAHAYTVPPIVGWLIWRQRHALAARPPRTAPWLLLPVAVAALGWLLGDLAAANAAVQLAFTALLVLSFVAVAGTRAARTVAFPLGFLFFMVPVGEFLMPQLMVWTADFTVQALRLSGIPVYREGLQFVIPTGNWSVVEACSGVRYLIASFMVGTLFAYLNYRSLRRRLLFIAVAIVVPVVANWVRAYGIVMLGHLSNNRLAAGADHLLYGWLFFGVVIVLMFMIGARWAEPEALPPQAGDEVLPAAAHDPSWRGTHGIGGRAWTVAVTTLLVAALPLAALRAIDQGAVVAPPALSAPSTLAGDWRLVAGGADPWLQPAFEKPAAAVNVRYGSAAGEVGMYLGYYQQQSYASKLISSRNQIVRSRDRRWAELSEGVQDHLQAGRPASGSTVAAPAWRTATLRGSPAADASVSERLLVWRLYWVDGHLTASDWQATAWGVAGRLFGRGDDAAVVVLTAPHAATEAAAENAEKLLAGFAADNLPAIAALLEQTRQISREAAARPARPDEARGNTP